MIDKKVLLSAICLMASGLCCTVSSADANEAKLAAAAADAKQDAQAADEKRKAEFDKILAQAQELAKDEEKALDAIKLAKRLRYDLAKSDEEKKQADDVLAAAQAKFAAIRPWAAVVDFTIDKTVEANITGSAIAVKLEQCAGPLIRLVNRANTEKAMKELQFQSMDIVDKTKAKEFGKLIGAEYLVTGSVVQFGKDITVAAQIINVETGAIRQTAEVTTSDIGEFNSLFPEIVRILGMNDTEKKAYLADKFNYPKHIADGNAAMLKDDYEEAVNCFRRAIAAKRTPEAEKALKNAEFKNKMKMDVQQRKHFYEMAMAEGNKALDAGKFKDAETSFNKALTITGYEDDAAAKEALKVVAGGPELKRKRDIARTEFQETMKKGDELLAKAIALKDKPQEAFAYCDKALEMIDNTIKVNKASFTALELGPLNELKVKIEEFNAKISATVKPEGGVPTKETNWAVPEVGMEFAWIKELNGWVGMYEVTNEQYRKFKPDHDSKSVDGNSLNDDRQPVVNVNYEDVQAFIKWLNETERRAGRLPKGFNYRLPAKDEWTTFAQCGDKREFPWGEGEKPRSGNFKIEGYEDGFPVTCPVDKSGKNEWTLNGVGGNVAELTQKSPTDPSFDSWRGGSWEDSDVQGLRAKSRNTFSAVKRSNYCGFRLVLMQ
ncbi:MAG TPA: hypothetical protein DCZ94_06050 [Lentisphaeria bacterium]|nr:MAG: hypothetical protein A2X48_21890 [Lentisphaerae bacterium GWF2_49_21]HBC86499.1 hypothetical protein [Lentisphaeria bacterium]